MERHYSEIYWVWFRADTEEAGFHPVKLSVVESLVLSLLPLAAESGITTDCWLANDCMSDPTQHINLIKSDGNCSFKLFISKNKCANVI